MKYSGQYNQDKVVDKLFKKKQSGFFVDVGAHDGIIFSNSYFFEKHRNWSGVCIEPIPEAYKELTQNRFCTTISGCVTGQSGNKKFMRVTGKHNMLSGLVEYYDTQHLERLQKDLNAHGGKIIELDVACYSLNQVLKDKNVRNVDYCSIDTEGAELDILEGFDFTQYNVSVFSIENFYISKEIRKLMRKKGYTLLTIQGVDEIYVKLKEVPFSLNLLKYYILGFLKKNTLTTQLKKLKRKFKSTIKGATSPGMVA